MYYITKYKRIEIGQQKHRSPFVTKWSPQVEAIHLQLIT